MPKETQPIHAGHRARMRIRFSETGLDGFRPHEVLEMLLFSVIPKRDVNPLAHALLDRFGTLDGVFSASCEELMETPGVGRQTAEFLKALDQTLDSYLASCHTSPHSIRSIAEALEYLPQSARTSLRFGVTVLFTDRHNRPVSVCSFPGRPDDPAVIREILDKSLSLHSHSAVVFCTGYRTVKPLSKQELEAFQPLIRALAGVDSFTVDCLLISPTHLISLRRENLLTGAATELQDNLVRWERWLGPIGPDPSETRWHPLSLLDESP